MTFAFTNLFSLYTIWSSTFVLIFIRIHCKVLKLQCFYIPHCFGDNFSAINFNQNLTSACLPTKVNKYQFLLFIMAIELYFVTQGLIKTWLLFLIGQILQFTWSKVHFPQQLILSSTSILFKFLSFGSLYSSQELKGVVDYHS